MLKVMMKMLWRVLGIVGMFMLYAIAQAIVLTPSMLHLNVSTTGQAILFAVAFGGLIWLLWLVYQNYLMSEPGGNAFHSVPFTRERRRLFFWLFIAMMGIQVIGATLIAMNATKQAVNQTELEALMRQAPLPMVLVAVVGGPPVEELMFRGILMHVLPPTTKHWGWIMGTVSAVSFGFMHANFSEPLNFLIYTGLGAVFAVAYVKTKDIRYSLGLHFLNNFLAIFL